MSELGRMREQVRGELGRSFEEKATDELVSLLAARTRSGRTRRTLASGREGATSLSRTGVEPSLVVEVVSGDRTSHEVAAGDLGGRLAAIAGFKDAFQRTSAPLREGIEKHIESVSGSERAARAIQSVWLADALRAPTLRARALSRDIFLFRPAAFAA